jgi:hypothetical protein
MEYSIDIVYIILNNNKTVSGSDAVASLLGRCRKDPHSPHRGNFCHPEGEGKKLFPIIVN